MSVQQISFKKKIGFSETGRSLLQRSPTECGVSECDREALIVMRLWSTEGCCAMGKKLELVEL